MADVDLTAPWLTSDMEFRVGQSFSEVITLEGADWSGTYTAEIGGLADVAVTAVFAASDTTLTIALTHAESIKLAAGMHSWHAVNAAGEPAFGGNVQVIPVG